MNRALRSMPWLLAAGACAAPVLALLGFFDSSLATALVVVGSVSAGLTARLVNRMPLLIVLAIVIGAARVVTLDRSSDFDAIASSTGLDIAISVLVGIGLALILSLAIKSRRGRVDGRDLNDLITVSVGALLATWIVATGRLIDLDGFSAFSAVSRTLVLPLSALLFAFIVDLLFTGLRSNRAMEFIVMAATANLVAAVVAVLRYDGLVGVDRSLEIGLYVAALGFMAAGMSHSSAPETVALRTTPDGQSAYTPLRLVMNGACLLIPGVLVATLPPLSRVDAAVRGVAVAVGIASVMTRLVFAVRSSDQVRDELATRVHRDELTQLPSRIRFVGIVDEILEDTWRSEFRPTILQLNLDRFKDINDSFGHYEANDVLLEVSQRLRRVVEPFGGVVGRLGGDDFAIVDGTTRTTEDALDRLALVRSALSEPLTIGERKLFVTASAGVAIAPGKRTMTADELLRRADIAIHAAKSAGRNSVEVFDDSMQARLAHRMDVEHALHGAIGRREMQLYHQPIVDLHDGRVSGFESLIRWQRDGAIVSPGEFIPIAEETGMIVEIGEWAIREALRELNRWIAEGIVSPATTISVNVSPRQFAGADLADVVGNALETSGVPASSLWLEVTESTMLEEPELAESTLRRIRELGVRIALDDFGTGYSSLSMLQQFPIDRIKIDRAFVNGIAEPGNDRSLVRTVIAMAQSMGLDLVAEGVETVQQLQTLSELSCDKAQGFLISRPVPAEAMRSTMVALDELASLSLFGGADGDAAPTPTPAISEVSAGSPARATRGYPVPVGASSRPLGSPVL